MDTLDPQKLCTSRLFRDQCSFMDNLHVKDLSKLGRDLSKTIIVDNSPNCYRLHKSNAVPIKTWTDDQTDTELLNLIPLLTQLAEVDDVREILPKCCSLTGEIDEDTIDCELGLEIIKQSMKSNLSMEQGQASKHVKGYSTYVSRAGTPID